MWELFWAVVIIAVMAQVCYSYGHWKGFKVGVVALRKEMERLLDELVEEKEKEANESKETP